MRNQDSPTNRQTGSYLDELMKELQTMNNIYESNHSVKFRNAHNLLIREIQRVWDAEMLMNSLGSGALSSSPSTEIGRVIAGRDADASLLELSTFGNILNEDSLMMTPSPAARSGSSYFHRRQSNSPMMMSLIGGGLSKTKDKGVEEEEEDGKFEKSEKLLFPSETLKNTNPIGRLIGPRGITIRQLEKDLGCNLFIRGKGCTKDEAREERLCGRPGWEHLDEPIHVLITVRADSEEKSIEKIQSIKKRLQEFLENPDSELKRAQLMQLAVIEGTLK